jgi:hypothetical protein
MVRTKHSAFDCKKEAAAAGNRDSKMVSEAVSNP